MIESKQFGPVKQFKMSTVIDGRPVYWVAAYLVDGLLIDAGCRHAAEEFVAQLADENIDRVAITHFHEDHVGACHLLVDRFGLELFAHPDSIPFMKNVPRLNTYQELVWGYPEPSEARPLPEVVETGRYRFEVIETPGHSIGHVVFLEREQGWCFSGDIFAREKLKVLRADENVGQTIASFKKLLNLAPDHLSLYTSVGKVVENGGQALQSCHDFLVDLVGQAKELERQGQNVAQIVITIFGEEHPFAFLTEGHYSTENLVRSALEAPQPD